MLRKLGLVTKKEFESSVEQTQDRNAELDAENLMLKARAYDLQIKLDEQKPFVVDQQERAHITRIAKEHEAMAREFEALGLFFRQFYKREIEAGEHAGLSTAEVVMLYLRKERVASGEGRRAL